MPVAPMAVDRPPPPPVTPSYSNHLLPLSSMDQVVLHQQGLEFLNQIRSARGDPPFTPGAPSSGAHPQKHGTLPPVRPTFPPPPLGLPLARAPPNWRAWITQCHQTNVGTPDWAPRSNSPITLSDLGAWQCPLSPFLFTSLLRIPTFWILNCLYSLAYRFLS